MTVVDLFAGELERVGHRRRDDDRGAVLVVVEDRNAHAGLRLLLDLEAFGALDVLEIDAAEGRLQRDDDVDQLVDVGLVDLDVEHVDAGELLEQDRLAFHHRLAGERADGAEAEHRGAVGQHRDQILPRRQIGGFFRIGDDRLAGEGDARRIGEREVALVAERLGRRDLELTGPRQAVIMQRVGLEDGCVFAGHGRFLRLVGAPTFAASAAGRKCGGARLSSSVRAFPAARRETSRERIAKVASQK